MRAKGRFSWWLKAAAVLAVAECTGVADVQAQSSGDFFRFNAVQPRSDKYRENWFNSLNWERQRKPHRQSDSSRASPHRKAKSKPVQSEPASSKKPVGSATLPSKTCRCRDRGHRPGQNRTPLPRRPAPVSIAGSVTTALSDCD